MKNILSEITEQEKNRILEMHRKSTSRFYLSEAEVKPGMTGKGNYQDTAEGKTYSVVKVDNLPCGVAEVQLKSLKSQRTEFAYYKPSEQTGNEISFRRSGEGVKSEDPCGEFESFGDFGRLQF